MDKMVSGVKKAAVVVSTANKASGHRELTMAMFEEKNYVEALNNVISAKLQATEAMVKWASQEDPVFKELFEKLLEVDRLWKQVHKDYIEQCTNSRQTYKEILRGEKSMEEIRKENEVMKAKLAKLWKQVESSARKNSATQQKELLKVIDTEEKSSGNLMTLEEDHQKFKMKKVKESLQCLSNTEQILHQKCLTLADAQQQLVKLFLGGKGKQDLDIMRYQSRDIMENLTSTLDIAPKRTSFFKSRVSSVDTTFDETPVYNPFPENDNTGGGSYVYNPIPEKDNTEGTYNYVYTEPILEKHKPPAVQSLSDSKLLAQIKQRIQKCQPLDSESEAGEYSYAASFEVQHRAPPGGAKERLYMNLPSQESNNPKASAPEGQAEPFYYDYGQMPEYSNIAS